MIIKILSVISMLLGGVLIFLAMCSTPKRVTKMNIDDKIVLEKYVKSQRVLNVIILFEKVAGFRIGKRFETLN